MMRLNTGSELGSPYMSVVLLRETDGNASRIMTTAVQSLIAEVSEDIMPANLISGAGICLALAQAIPV